MLVLGVPPLRGVAVIPAGREILSGPVAAEWIIKERSSNFRSLTWRLGQTLEYS